MRNEELLPKIYDVVMQPLEVFHFLKKYGKNY